MMGMSSMMGSGVGRMPDFSAMRERMFTKADGDASGAVSLEEFQKAGQSMPGGQMRSAEKAKEAFGKIDTDGNGSLSREEMDTFSTRMSSQMQDMMLKMQQMMGGAGGGMMGGGMPDPSAMFGKADGDGDGAVSRAEFDQMRSRSPMAGMMGGNDGARADEMFGKIDSDGDGALSQDEVTAFSRAARGRMGGGSGDMAAAGGGASQFMQAMNAYRSGSQQSADMTSVLLKALDGAQAGKKA
jgi:Ca2+-binding EF-hand superfamily protein